MICLEHDTLGPTTDGKGIPGSTEAGSLSRRRIGVHTLAYAATPLAILTIPIRKATEGAYQTLQIIYMKNAIGLVANGKI